MQSIWSVRTIFRMRERIMGSRPGVRVARGILDELGSLGWGCLLERPDELYMGGAVCQPWLADVKFSAIAPQEFTGYAEADQVKIAWTLEAQEVAPGVTRFAQETRVVATDAEAREKFRRYWRWARFGIVAIRLLLLPAVRREAERPWAEEAGR